MRIIQYFVVQDGGLILLDEKDPIVQEWDGIDNQALTIEVWPQDLRLKPCRRVPLDKDYETGKESRVDEIIRLNRETREQNPRNDQGVLVRVNKASSPYAQEFTKRDDARNRAYLSQKVSKRRKKGQIPPAQADAPF